jgi:hypothetical protein
MCPAERVAKAAVFVDAENQTSFSSDTLLRALAHLDLVEKHAFADWRDRRLERNGNELHGQGFQLHHVPSGKTVGEEKNKADQCMARYIRTFLRRRPDIKVVVLVTGDHYFTGIVRELQQQNIRVIIGASPMSVSKNLCLAADQYLPLGELASWIKTLDNLERHNRCLTSSGTLAVSGLSPNTLQWLQKVGVVGKGPQGAGESPAEISLNRKAHAVRMVLNGSRAVGAFR